LLLLKREHEAFLDGYKPALLISPRSKFFDIVSKTDFPRITPFDDEDNSHIFFQTEHHKLLYSSQIEGVSLRTYDFHKIVGKTLGFPKESVLYFAKMRDLEEEIGNYPEDERINGVGVIWAGFFFASHLEFVEREVQWLWNTYQHEKAVGQPLYLWTKETDYIVVQYLDFARLKELKEEIQEGRKQKATA
jgi:hypothetical protein